jgi:protein transport protein SEC31
MLIWKEVMATLATFADQSEFPDLCEALGDRLEEAISENASYRKDASFCYLAGSKLEKVVVNWTEELKENEAAGLEKSEEDNSFSIHARSLQDFIEKVTVFRKVTNFKDADHQKDADWKLEPLYAKYVEYADIASAHGQLAIAEKYLDLLPAKYPAAEVAKDRVKRATQKATTQASAQRQSQPVAGGRNTRVVPTPTPAQQTSSPYAPSNPLSAPAPAASPYAPVNPLGAQAQAQAQSQGPVRNPYLPTPNAFAHQPPSQPSTPYGNYGQPQQNSLPPPPKSFGQMPATSTVPAVNRGHIPAWNDTPDFGVPKPVSRRGTPLNTVGSPFPNQQAGYGMPPQGPPQGRPTPPPPPKGPPQGPPRVMSPPQSSASPSAPSPYAPVQPAGFAPPQQPPLPRGTSPYAPPTSAAPASNRYAPAPGSQPSPAPSYGGMPPPRNIAPPPTQYTPAASPYAASPAQQAPPAAAPPPPRGPPQGPPRAGPPPGGPPQSGPPRPDSRSSPAPPPAAAPAAAKHRKLPSNERYLPPANYN